ncbi:hypothetical protein, partial [Polynucleobacter sp. AP-Latsch-80-C2]|uniref:hypothetical protein n=1 Tax=Polynucleobacter sp. AP-Latsch-80-C2 TaxID=2576931 RepID=UPI001C0E5B45
ITTTGAQTYTGAVTLGSDIVLTSSAAGTSGDITFSSTIDSSVSARALTITTASGAHAIFGGKVGNTSILNTLSISAGLTTVNSDTIKTSSTQTYTGAVTLGASSTLTASGITFGSTVAMAGNSLTLTANALSLGGTVSATGATGTLTIQPNTVATTIGLGSGITSSSCGVACSLVLSDAQLGYINGSGFAGVIIGSTSGTGAVAYNTGADITFASPLTIRSQSVSGGGSITISDTLNVGSTNNLTISTYGAVSLSAINTANVLAVTGNGITLNGSITTTGTQTYTGAVTLGSDV